MSCPFAHEPVFPPLQPNTSSFPMRLVRGLQSWLALLMERDYRIAIGSLNFLGLNLFLLNQPEAVRRVMVDEVESFPKHPYTLWILEPLIGRGIFSVNGEEWARQRRIVDQALQTAQLQRVLPQMEEATRELIARLEPLADGSSVAIDREMTLVTADVIIRTILSRPLADSEGGEILEAFSRYQKRAGQVLLLRFLRLPQAWLSSYLAPDAQRIRHWIRSAIDQRLDVGRYAGAPLDVLQALLEALDPISGSGLSQEELVDQVCVLFLAGHETSASVLAMAAYLLAEFPEAQERLRAEVLAAAPGDDHPLGFNELRQLPYATALFNETLRLYPPLTFFVREARREITLIDRRCPVGSLLAISPWVIQRHEQHWSEPNAFRPERFLTGAASAEERQQVRDAFLPFGLGPRKCPGAAFAQQEALLVLAELVRRYRLLPDGNHTPDLVARLTLRSRNGIRLRLERLAEENP
ncbi:MAG: cytochrome P450 [Synechococcus sp. ELA619]